MTTDAETIEQFDSVMHFIAQAAINITEGLITIEEGSPIHHAMIKLCQLVNEGKVGVKLTERFVAVSAEDVITAVSTMRASLSTEMVGDPELVERLSKAADRMAKVL